MPLIVDIFGALWEPLNLIFFEAPLFVVLSAVLVLLGLGLRKSWLTMTGVGVTFVCGFVGQVVMLA